MPTANDFYASAARHAAVAKAEHERAGAAPNPTATKSDLAASACRAAADALTHACRMVLLANQAVSRAVGPDGNTVDGIDYMMAVHACPRCHERRADSLVWQGEDAERVECFTCGAVFVPGDTTERKPAGS